MSMTKYFQNRPPLHTIDCCSYQLLTSNSLQPKILAIWNPVIFSRPFHLASFPSVENPCRNDVTSVYTHGAVLATYRSEGYLYFMKVQKWWQPPQNYINAAVKTPLENL